MNPSVFLAAIFCVGLSLVCSLSTSDTGKIDTIILLEGENLLLKCNTTELKHIQEFYWVKNGTHGRSSEIYSNDWKIRFFDISRQASGIYICHGLDNSTNENITLTTVTVDVQYPAECDGMTLSPRVITENQTFVINCSFHGNPAPVWSIFNNDTGRVVINVVGGLNDSSNIAVSCGDSGIWVCSGYNEINYQRVYADCGYHLTVLCPPRPEPVAPPSYVYYYKTTVGVPVTMSLNITADPDPTYTWSRDDGSGIEAPNKVTQTPKGTSLKLLDVGVKDFGNYKLRMHNPYGSFVAHFVLQAYGFPGAPYDVRVGNITDIGSADVAWLSGYDMGSQQRFYIVRWINANTSIKISDDINGPYKDGGLGHPWNYHLIGLAHATHYVISVVAENSGNMTYSQRINFNTTQRGSGHYHASGHMYYIVGGAVGGMLVLIMVVIASLTYFIKQRSSTSPLNEKKRILQNIQTEHGYYGDAPSDGNVKTPLPNSQS